MIMENKALAMVARAATSVAKKNLNERGGIFWPGPWGCVAWSYEPKMPHSLQNSSTAEPFSEKGRNH